MRTSVCDRLGIEFPILAFSHCRDVVAAVSKAGGFGVLGVTTHTLAQLEVDLAWIEEQVGDKGYGVDVLIPAKYAGSEEGGISDDRLRAMIPAEHRVFLDELLVRYGVPPLPPDDSSAKGAMTLSHKGAMPLVELSLAHKGVRLVANALGPAPAELVSMAHDRDVLVAGLTGKKVHAERQKAAGVDFVIAQGYEAGGHTGEIATMVLVPEIVDAVAPTPVLAAGGIARGRQMAAAMALGAQGVWTGSVWLTTEEAETHPVVKQKFLAATASDTLRSRASTGKPARQLRTAWTDEWEDPANPKPLGMPLHTMLIGEAQRRIQRSALVPGSGAEKLINYYVGQVVGSLNSVKSARQVVLDMVEEYLDVVEGLHRQVQESAG